MSFWGSLTGRKTSATADASSSASPVASFTEDLSSSDIATSSSPGTDLTFDASPEPGPSVKSFLGANINFDPAVLHPLAGLNKDTLDYFSLEESALSQLPGSRSALPSRGWSDDLCYGTGVTYLTALSLGGAWGLTEGLRWTPPRALPGVTTTVSPRLRINSCLNAITRRGPFLGNSAGVIALIYNGINSTIGHVRGKHDAFNSVLAGGISGMLFKSTRGLKPMVISSGLVATAAGAWAVSFYLLRSFTLHHQITRLILISIPESRSREWFCFEAGLDMVLFRIFRVSLAFACRGVLLLWRSPSKRPTRSGQGLGSFVDILFSLRNGPVYRVAFAASR